MHARGGFDGSLRPCLTVCKRYRTPIPPRGRKAGSTHIWIVPTATQTEKKNRSSNSHLYRYETSMKVLLEPMGLFWTPLWMCKTATSLKPVKKSQLICTKAKSCKIFSFQSFTSIEATPRAVWIWGSLRGDPTTQNQKKKSGWRLFAAPRPEAFSSAALLSSHHFPPRPPPPPHGWGKIHRRGRR